MKTKSVLLNDLRDHRIERTDIDKRIKALEVLAQRIKEDETKLLIEYIKIEKILSNSKWYLSKNLRTLTSILTRGRILPEAFLKLSYTVLVLEPGVNLVLSNAAGNMAPLDINFKNKRDFEIKEFISRWGFKLTNHEFIYSSEETTLTTSNKIIESFRRRLNESIKQG